MGLYTINPRKELTGVVVNPYSIMDEINAKMSAMKVF